MDEDGAHQNSNSNHVGRPHGADGLPAHPAAAHPNPPQQQAPPGGGRLGVSCLLEFHNPRIEATYQQYMGKVQQAADLCVIGVNLFAVAVAYSKQYVLPPGTGPPTHLLCVVSGSQSLALLLLLLVWPGTYSRHRGAIMMAVRMYRLAVWLLFLREPFPSRLFRDNLSLRLFLLSPAAGNIWLSLFYPLPMPLHLGLLGLSTLVATWPSAPLRQRLDTLGASHDALAAAYTRLSRFSRFLEMPSGRLLQRWPGPTLSDSDQIACMYGFVTIVYGLLLPLLLLYVKEVHFRVRFLSCLVPAASPAQLAALRSSLYSTTTRACFLLITLVPCAWTLVQLAARYVVLPAGQYKPALSGLAFVVTVLSLEVFMRFWLLAVLQLLLHRVVRPALLWLLLRLSGTAVVAAPPGARAGPRAA